MRSKVSGRGSRLLLPTSARGLCGAGGQVEIFGDAAASASSLSPDRPPMKASAPVAVAGRTPAIGPNLFVRLA
jgi:hypothetical protein